MALIDMSIYSDVELNGFLLEASAEVERRAKLGATKDRMAVAIQRAMSAGLEPEAVAEIVETRTRQPAATAAPETAPQAPAATTIPATPGSVAPVRTARMP